jgi:ribosome biogenesis GTPase
MNETIKARIIRSGKKRFECKALADGRELFAVALREVYRSQHPVVGDIVELTAPQSGQEYEIFNIIPRVNEIYRRIVRENKKKVIASNVDVIFIVTSVSKPDYKSGLIDRYLIRSIEWDVPAVIVFNKMDEFKDQFDIEFEKAKYEFIGAQTFFLSSTHVDQFQDEFNRLKNALKDKSAICLGQSGVGKSKLISALSGGQVNLLSKDLAKGIKKGAHTTTWAEIIDCGSFRMIDSPGVRSMSINDVPKDDLMEYFPEVAKRSSHCRFQNCRHFEDSKDCYFNTLNPEILEDAIVLDRLYSYMKMREEVETIPEWKK